MPFDANCGGCWHHGDSSDGSGQCRALPPDQPMLASRVVTYRHTRDTEHACALYRPKVEPEPAVAETKAEKIERLRREGCTDLAAFKRALDGR